MNWFVFNEDDGLVGVYRRRRDARDSFGGPPVQRRYSYRRGGGDYGYVVGYDGEGERWTTYYVVNDPELLLSGRYPEHPDDEAVFAGHPWRRHVVDWEDAGKPHGPRRDW